MASVGPNSPGLVVNSNNSGADWGNPENAAASDDVYATATVAAQFGVTDHLVSSAYGFSVPDGATVDGFVAEAEVKASPNSSSTMSSQPRLVIGGSMDASKTPNPSGNSPWSETDSSQSFGGAAQLWGYTGATAGNVNDSGFGWAFLAQVIDVSAGAQVNSVDHMRMTVYYTEGAAAASTARNLLLLGCG